MWLKINRNLFYF